MSSEPAREREAPEPEAPALTDAELREEAMLAEWRAYAERENAYAEKHGVKLTLGTGR